MAAPAAIDVARPGAGWMDGTWKEKCWRAVVNRPRRRCETGIGNKLPLRTEHGMGYSFSQRLQISSMRQAA